MGVKQLVRDSFCGRVIYHFSGHRWFSYKEEQPGYVIPDKYLIDAKNVVEKSDEVVECRDCSDSESSTADSTRIMVTWDGEDDPENPRNWPMWIKLVFMLQIYFLTVSVYMGSAIYTPGIEDLMSDLGVSRVKATVPLTMFVVGYGIGPMFWSPMSENAVFGRTYIYIFTLFVYVILQIPISLVKSIAALSVLRFLAGFFASPALSTGGASMGDIISIPYLPLVIAAWCMGPTSGPSLGPLVGSVLVVKRDWHWTFWFMCIISGIALVVLSVLLPETYEKTLLLRKAKRLRKLTGNDRITSEGEIENEGLTVRDVVIKTLWRPIEMTLFEPIVFSINLYIALVYSMLYLWFEAFPKVFIGIYNFDLIPYGVTFSTSLIGGGMGAIAYIWYMYYYFTKRVLAGQEMEPEFFLPVMVVSAVIMPVGILIFAWTSTKEVHWFGPIAGASIYFFGCYIVFQTGLNYLGSSFFHYIASVYAGNALFRALIAGVFPLFADPLYDNLATKKFPVAWGTSIIGFILTGMIAIPVVFYWLGPKLRARSRYSSLNN